MIQHFLFAMFQLSLTLLGLVHAQNQSGYVSIDCGLVDEPSYTDANSTIYYTSDANFTDAGVSYSISSKYKVESLERQFWNVRSFPEGTRNCYTINAPRGSSSKYLVRARFMYGNYDGKDSLPEFDIYLGAKLWGSVVLENASSVMTKEIIYVASSDYVYICLFDTNKGTPFISALELRVLSSDAYLVNSLELLARFDIGLRDGQVFRYPDDVYDRIWTPYNSIDWRQINTPLTVDQGASSYNFLPLPPSIVMRTAAMPENVSNNMQFYFVPRYNASIYYAYMYFAEIQKLQANEIREFNIFVNGDLLNSNPVSPSYLQTVYYIAALAEPQLELWFNRTNRSTLPPLINAIEIYMSKDLLQSETDQTDADAIMSIKSIYGIKRNWQGDPCAPRAYLWEGLHCRYAGSGPPRIISLNLSSSGLNGNIAPDISNLKSIESLDLSNNSLTGDVPGFLSQLRFLRVLNLEGNQLSGTIPIGLIQSSKNGLLKFSFGGNQNICSSGSCNERSKNKLVIALVVSLGGTFLLLAVAVAFSIFKRRQLGLIHLNQLSSYSKLKKQPGSEKQQFTYTQILSITNNFERVVGTGGFGTVYYGYLGNAEVAVKMLFPSAQGYLQFQAEAELLTRVHHKCLTGFIGYCDDGINMGLIYEYMANGDLADHLSDKKENILSWKQRLQIAVDAAEGLEYMHSGCKPPIVHRDVKSRNILLNKEFRGKLADFGLSKIFPNEGDTHMSTVIAGTRGYLDPEYNRTNRLNEKSDVFSFGVVLLEIITGRPAIAKSEEKIHLIQWLNSMLPGSEVNDIVDARLQGEFNTESASKALGTAMVCVAPASSNRPTMSHVVMELKECLKMEMTGASHSHGSSRNSITDVSFDRISGESSLAR